MAANDGYEFQLDHKTGTSEDEMLTMLAVPKAFKGHIATIQRNAIRSWLEIRPKAQVILFADEEGTAEIAKELGVQHVPGVARNGHGTPLLDGVIREGRRLARHPMLCYVNCDIILTSEFVRAVEEVSKKLEKFLGVARRINVDVREPLPFGADWEADLASEVQARGVMASEAYIDIFIFPSSCYQKVPAFAVGRPWFDHWFIKAAHNGDMPVVELTAVAPLIHQNHDYGHVDGGMEAIWRSEETQKNLELYGKIVHDYTLADVTHEIFRDGSISKKLRAKKPFSLREALWELLVVKTFPLRKRLGLRRG
jgi:hypothetical protein